MEITLTRLEGLEPVVKELLEAAIERIPHKRVNDDLLADVYDLESFFAQNGLNFTYAFKSQIIPNALYISHKNTVIFVPVSDEPEEPGYPDRCAFLNKAEILNKNVFNGIGAKIKDAIQNDAGDLSSISRLVRLAPMDQRSKYFTEDMLSAAATYDDHLAKSVDLENKNI